MRDLVLRMLRIYVRRDSVEILAHREMDENALGWIGLGSAWQVLHGS